jgi:STE24 endopeptidase
MNVYLIIILFIIIGSYLFNLIIEVLNIKNLKPELPEEFKGDYDQEKYKISQVYLKENTRFDLVSDSIMTPLMIAFILFGGFNVIDRLARGFGFGAILTGLIYVGILMFINHLIHLPLSVYHTFVIEEKYGFNKTTPRTFIFDLLKNWLLALIIGGAILSLILWFFEKTGPLAWLYCWIAVTLFQLFLAYLAPVVILPIFNKFIPLPDGDLKQAIEEYARGQKFKLKGIYSMDGSRRSTKANAFFTGFGRFRRIVLFDTLINKHTVDELVSILAHEMGHYKKRHILKTLLLGILNIGVMFFILSIFINNEELFQAFKMQETSVYASLLFFAILYSPIEMILSLFSNFLSRKHEYEADHYAIKTFGKPKAMINALKKLHVDNLSNLTPHPLMVVVSYSHPPILERIEAMRKDKSVAPEGDWT